MTDIQALRQQYKEQKAALLQQLQTEGATTRGIHGLLTRLARLVDELLAELWQRAGFPEAFALAAVGGYGRGQLYPHSDVDVLVLLPPYTAAYATYLPTNSPTGLPMGDFALGLGDRQLRDRARRLHAGHARHADVEEGDVGVVLLDELHRLGAVLRLGDDLQRRPHLGQARAQLIAHQPFVVGDHRTQGRCRVHAAIVAPSRACAT